MPISKKQGLVFSILMSFMMTYVMELYNLSLNSGGFRLILMYRIFLSYDLYVMMLLVFGLQNIIGGPLARHLSDILIKGNEIPPIIKTIVVTLFTVTIMCPLMSMAATILFKYQLGNILIIWLITWRSNFIIAFFWQYLGAGPLVRGAFNKYNAKHYQANCLETSTD